MTSEVSYTTIISAVEFVKDITYGQGQHVSIYDMHSDNKDVSLGTLNSWNQQGCFRSVGMR